MEGVGLRNRQLLDCCFADADSNEHCQCHGDSYRDSDGHADSHQRCYAYAYYIADAYHIAFTYADSHQRCYIHANHITHGYRIAYAYRICVADNHSQRNANDYC